jgi:hypothetical protein
VEADPPLGDGVLASNYIKTLPPSRPFGLVFGVLRPSTTVPCPGESILLPRLIAAIAQGVPEGTEMRAPADVVLDRENGLVLHPAIALVLARRAHTLRPDGSVWGPPDVVVELSWPAIARRLRCVKLPWYHKFGVGECWIVSPYRNRIEVISLATMHVSQGQVFPSVIPHIFSANTPMASPTFPDVRLTASSLFHGVAVRGWSATARQRFEPTFADEQEGRWSSNDPDERSDRHARRQPQ